MSDSLDRVISPHINGTVASNLETFQLSSFSFTDLDFQDTYRFGELFYKRNLSSPVKLYLVKMNQTRDFVDLWKGNKTILSDFCKINSLCTSYSDRKIKTGFFDLLYFMSFSPMELIFIGWVGDMFYFCWVLRNFDFKPANEIFSKKGKMSFVQKTCFLWV